MANQVSPFSSEEIVPIQLHPRVLAALGKELITNDFVAIIELVKNSYDAMATRVDLRFIHGADDEGMIIEIEDNGTGMKKDTITGVWAVVATPFRQINPISKVALRTRRVSGEKGLGRLSAARLGDTLEIFTKPVDEPCWYMKMDWNALSQKSSMDACGFTLRTCENQKRLSPSGTLLRISNLRSTWKKERLQALEDELARLISPFEKLEDFKIFLSFPGSEAEYVEIKSAEFLAKPPYMISGSVSTEGELHAKYQCAIDGRERVEWINTLIRPVDEKDSEDSDTNLEKSEKESKCGPFDFEIRAWDDITIADLSSRLEKSKREIGDSIKAHRGISLYRDNILVIPKTDSARDWLGLDIRRVSWVGPRLSTNQIIGYVLITSENNPNIKDTTDRERLEDNPASNDFRNLMVQIIIELENQRNNDRPKEKQTSEPPLKSLFEELNPSDIVETVNDIALKGGDILEIVPMVQAYKLKVQNTVEEIEKRFFYYSRLATLGILAAIVVHEVRNHTMSLNSLIDDIEKMKDEKNLAYLLLEDSYKIADNAVTSLERLAEQFAPLASRAFRKKKRNSMLAKVFSECISMRQKDILSKKVDVRYDKNAQHIVAIDPGELIAIFINLIENSLYWFSFIKNEKRIINLHTEVIENSRLLIRFDDSGPGVRDGEEEKIFWPGITRKPNGLGMGLTVAAEIVAQHGGRMALEKPGELGGASFRFDLPLIKEA